MKQFILAMTLLLTTFFAGAQVSYYGDDHFPREVSFMDGNKLLNHCEHSPQIAEGMVMGVHDAHSTSLVRYYAFLKDEPPVGPPVMCVPMNATSGELRDVVCKYLNQNPEYRHERARRLIVRALGAAFQCLEYIRYEDDHKAWRPYWLEQRAAFKAGP